MEMNRGRTAGLDAEAPTDLTMTLVEAPQV